MNDDTSAGDPQKAKYRQATPSSLRHELLPAFAAFLLAFAVLFIVAHKDTNEAPLPSSPTLAKAQISQPSVKARPIKQSSERKYHPIARAEPVDQPHAPSLDGPRKKTFRLHLAWLHWSDSDGDIHLGLIDGDALAISDDPVAAASATRIRTSAPFDISNISPQLTPVSGGGTGPLAPQGTTTNAVWNGGSATTNNWNDTTNWVSNNQPQGGDPTTQIHFAGTTRLTPNNDYGAFTQEGSIIFDSGAGAFTLGGNAVKLAGSITNNSSNTQTYNQTGLSMNPTASGGATSFNAASGNLIINTPGSSIFLDNNAELDLQGANTITINAPIANGGGSVGKVVVLGSGTFIYAGANTYTGGTFINNGTLRFDTGGSLTSSQTLTLGNNTGSSSATLSIGNGSGLTVANPITVRAGSTGTKTLSGSNASGTNTFSGQVTLNTDFSASSAGGILDLTGAITTVGGSGVAQVMTVTAGTVQLSGSADNVNLGVTVNSGGTLILNKTSTGSVHAFGNSSTVALGGTLKLSGTGGDQIFNSAGLTVDGTFDLNALSETIGSLSGSGIVTNNATGTPTLTVGGSNNGTFSGTIQDGGAGKTVALLKNGSGNLTLSGANTYSAGTTWGTSGGGAGGILTFGSSSIGGPGSITSGPIGTGTFTISNTSATTGSNFLQSSDSTTRTISNAIAFNGTGLNFNFGGAGDLIFDGTVVLGTTSATRTFAVNNTNTAFTGPISGTGGISLAKAGTGTLILSGSNSYNGSTAINAGTLSINTIKNVSGGSSAVGAPTTVANGTIGIGNTTTSGTLKYTGTGDTTNRVINLAGTTGGAFIDQSGTGLLKFTSDFTATGSGAKTLTLQGSTAGTGEVAGKIVDSAGGATSVVKLGTGTWTLSGANTYTGSTTIGSLAAVGGTLKLGLNNALPVGTSLIFLGGDMNPSTLDLNGLNQTVGALTDSGNASGAITNTGSAATFTLNNTNSAFFFGPISGALSFVKTGIGTQDIGAANTYTGGTTIKAGTIVISNTAEPSGPTSGPLGASSASVVLGDTTGSANASLLLGRTSQATGGYTLANNITIQDGNSGTMTLGTQNTGGTNTFSGNVTLGNTTNTGKSLTLSAAAGSELDMTGNILANGTSVAALTIAGGGTVKLTGTNTYAGLTTVSNASILDITNSSALGTATNGTTVNNASALWLENNISIAAEALTLNGDGNSTNGALRSVSGNNTYGGAITLASASRIHSSVSSQLTLTGGITNGGFRLTLSGTGDIVIDTAGITGTGGDILKQGTGSATFDIASSFTGSSGGANNVFLDEGRISIGASGALGTTNGTTTGLVNMGSAGIGGLSTILNIASSGVTLANPIDVRFLQTGGKTISGTFTSGSSTYSGNITLHDNVTLSAANGGTLKFGGVIATAGSGTNAAPPTGGFGTGPGVLINVGGSSTGIVEYDNAMTYSGDTVVNSGTLQFNANGSTNNSTIRLGVLGPATVNLTGASSVASTVNVRSSTGTKTISGSNASGTATYGGQIALDDDATTFSTNSGATLAFTQARASGVSTVTGTDIKGHTLTIDGAGDTTFGTATTSFGTIYNSVGSGSIIKTGNGTATFNDQNTYSGGTTVSAGVLFIANSSGSATGSGAVTVNSSGTLAGTGFINSGANTITINGMLSPGASPGTIHLASSNASTGAVTLSSTSTLLFDIVDLSTKDLVALTNTNLTLGGGLLALNLPNTGPSGIDYTQSYTIFSGVNTLTGTFGSVTGYDTADYMAEFSFTGGNYNLSFTPIPEPSTWIAGGIMLGALLFTQRGAIRRRLKPTT